ncbi:hypothetical protein GCM10022295_91190 [Streptomyces osmaniensis]|uniref:Uncharacterized protein n=1 Tax=Streptomyces osmaniensis TaxID=593134 RepID=A0ABP6Z1U9_9ACTN
MLVKTAVMATAALALTCNGTLAYAHGETPAPSSAHLCSIQSEGDNNNIA